MGTHFLLKASIGREAVSWVCILAASPLAVLGFFHYNGLTAEQFVWAFIKTNILFARERHFYPAGFPLTPAGKRKGGGKAHAES